MSQLFWQSGKQNRTPCHEAPDCCYSLETLFQLQSPLAGESFIRGVSGSLAGKQNDRNILGKSFRLRCKVHPVRNRLGNRRRANSFCWRTRDRLISQHHLRLGHSNMEYLKSKPGRNIGRLSDHHSWRNSCDPRRDFIVLQTDVQADI